MATGQDVINEESKDDRLQFVQLVLMLSLHRLVCNPLPGQTHSQLILKVKLHFIFQVHTPTFSSVIMFFAIYFFFLWIICKEYQV